MKTNARSIALLTLALLIGCSGQDKPEKKVKRGTTTLDDIKNMSAEEAALSFHEAEKNLDILTYWNHLPTSYQNKHNDLIRYAANNIDKEVWDAVVRLALKLSRILDEKSDFVLGNIFFKNFEDLKLKIIHIKAVSKTIKAICESDLKDIEKMKAADLETMLKKLAPKLDKELELLAEARSEIRLDVQKPADEIKFKYIKNDGENVILEKIEDGKGIREETYQKIDEVWFSRELLKVGDANLKSGKARIDKIGKKEEDKKKMLQTLEKFDKVFDAMLQADTQEKFDEQPFKLLGLLKPLFF